MLHTAQNWHSLNLIVWNCQGFCVKMHIKLVSEGRKHTPPPERENLCRYNKIKQVANVLWSLWSMTVPTATLLIQYLRLQNKLPVKHRLPQLQGQPTVRHKLRWALRHVTHRAKSFHNSALSRRLGIANDDCGIPTEVWGAWNMNSEINYSSLSVDILNLSYSVCLKLNFGCGLRCCCCCYMNLVFLTGHRCVRGAQAMHVNVHTKTFK